MRATATIKCPEHGVVAVCPYADRHRRLDAHLATHGEKARDEGLAAVTDASDSQDIAVVDQAILTVASRLSPFSANDVRPLLPVLRSNNLVGARFNALARAGRIRRHGKETVQSSDAATHAHDIKVWISTEVQEVAA